MVLYLKFLRQGLNSAIQKVCALITHQNYWTSKSTYDVFKNELCSCGSMTIPYYFGLYPSGEVFCSCDDVSRTSLFSLWVDRTQKIYSPFVNYSQCNLWSQQHFISPQMFSYPLEDIATSAKCLSVFMQSRPP